MATARTKSNRQVDVRVGAGVPPVRPAVLDFRFLDIAPRAGTSGDARAHILPDCAA